MSAAVFMWDIPIPHMYSGLCMVLWLYSHCYTYDLFTYDILIVCTYFYLCTILYSHLEVLQIFGGLSVTGNLFNSSVYLVTHITGYMLNTPIHLLAVLHVCSEHIWCFTPYKCTHLFVFPSFLSFTAILHSFVRVFY